MYLRNSPALRSLDVRFYPEFTASKDAADTRPSTHALGLILEALAVSVCIKKLILNASEFFPGDAFVNLMERTPSIHTLVIRFPIGEICTPSLPYMCNAFSLNRSLRRLTLDLGIASEAPGNDILTTSLFTALGNHPVLHDLVVYSTHKHLSFFSTMAVLLRLTSSLNHLSLASMGVLDAVRMEFLTQGLQQNNSIQELSWTWDANRHAVRHFIEYMQSLDSKNIRALNFGFHPCDGRVGLSLGKAVGQILSKSNSSLQAVRFDAHRYDLVELFHAIHVSGASNSLRILEIRKLEGVRWHKLIDCLPAMAHLKELIVPPVPQGELPHLVEALRCNGSLHKLSFWSESPPSSCILNFIDE